MEATLHGVEGGHKVRMIGRVDAHAVDFPAHLVQHHAKVGEGGNASVGGPFGELATVNIAQGHDIFPLGALVGHARDAAGADHRDVDLTVGGGPGLPDGKARKND